jgi:flagellar basal-body rod modification protein FlgD
MSTSNTITQIGTTASQVGSTVSNVLGTTPTTTSTTSTGSTSSSTNNVAALQTIAGNYDTFLQLLTTQLQNQDPLDPLDTDQFTQQLVEFASVEQQVNMNTNLQTLITMQQTSEATSALQLIGSTVTLNSNSATLSNATGSPASWSLSTTTPATASITISSSTGQVAYTGTLAVNAGTQSFTWNGQSNGVTWPDGSYTISINATGANGQAVTVTPQVQGTITGVNISQNPPTVTVNGQSVPINQIQSISNSTLSSLSSLGSSITNLNTSITSLSTLL